MVSLINKAFKGKSLVTSWGKIEFSNEGVAEVEDAIGEKLSKLNGFTLVGKVSTTDKENKQENKNKTTENQDTTPDTEETNTEEDEATITAKELETMNVPQLKKYAKELGMDVTNLNKRQELIDAILAK